MQLQDLIKLMYPQQPGQHGAAPVPGSTVNMAPPRATSDDGGGMPSVSDGIAQAGAAIGAGLQKRGEDNAAMTSITPAQQAHMEATAPQGAPSGNNGVVPGAQPSTLDIMNQLYPPSAPPQYDMMQRYEDPLRKKKPYESSLFGA